MNKALATHLTRILEEGWLGTIPRCLPEGWQRRSREDRIAIQE